MSVEIHEEAMTASPNYNSSSSVSNDQCSPGIAKRKRTKRQMQLRHSPAPPSSPTHSSSSGEYHSGGSATEEEEDMANCLILLAQGHALQDAHPKPQPTEKDASVGGGSGERFTSRRLAEATTMANGKVGFYVYECKTCSKCFPSFQALGGHRASHKKPKMAPVAAVMAMEENKPARDDIVLPLRSIAPCPNYPGVHSNLAGGSTGVIGNTKPRVHECSICGSEFSSGQALGGHMRRHRAAAAAVPEPLPEAPNFPQLPGQAAPHLLGVPFGGLPLLSKLNNIGQEHTTPLIATLLPFFPLFSSLKKIKNLCICTGSGS